MNYLNIIEKTQHCQRNWDYNQDITNELYTYLYDCAVNTSTKFNLQSFQVYLFTERVHIKEIAKSATSLDYNHKYIQNPQVDAPLLFVFTKRLEARHEEKSITNILEPKEDWKIRQAQEIGISAQSVAMAAVSLGMRTGFCNCFDPKKFPKNIFTETGCDSDLVSLFLGVGYPLKNKKHYEYNSKYKKIPYKKKHINRLIY